MYSVSAVPIKPILVHIDGVPNDRYAATVEDLMGMLTSDEWPMRTNDIVWRKALFACMSAIQAQGNGGRARIAFAEAAHMAEISILPDDEMKPLAETRKRHGGRQQMPIHAPRGIDG